MNRIIIKMGYSIVLLLVYIGLFAWNPQNGYAHASLVEANPAPNSVSSTAPAVVSLSFNEKIEQELYYVNVYGESGKKVTEEQAARNADGKGLLLQLPSLADGIYTISYHVISEDGHPVEGSYVITVGKADVTNGESDVGVSREAHLHQGHELSAEIGFSEWIRFGSRILYFFALLTLTGWVLWGVIIRRFSKAEIRSYYVQWGTSLQRAHLIALILLIYFQSGDLLGSEGSGNEWLRLFTETGIGLSWLISLFLALSGFLLFFRRNWLDVLWVLGMIAAKCFSGHSLVFEPKSVSLLLNFIHLLAAGLWAGGLLLLLLLWKKDRDSAEKMAPLFSKIAWISIVVLIGSGTIATLIFLPSLTYVMYTQWGTLLLVKVSLVVLVLFVAGWQRRKLKKKHLLTFDRLLKVDFSLMIVIVGIVGVLTYVSPLPANEPFHWHVMGSKNHMTAEISPNKPGSNRFNVMVWLPEQSGAPKQVLLQLHYQDDREIAPIQVPLHLHSDEAEESFAGFTQYSYQSEGPFMPFPGTWLVEVRIMDANDNETVYKKETKVY